MSTHVAIVGAYGSAGWNPTPDDELRDDDLREAGADQSRDERADGSEGDARRPPAGVVGVDRSVGRLDHGRSATAVFLFEEIALALSRFTLFGDS